MSTASRAAEAEKVTIAYQIALTKLGAQTIAEALALWKQDTPESPASASRWMSRAIALIMRRRAEARALARAYYRLERALRTGFTVADPSDKQTSTTLNDLRNEFRQTAGPAAPGPSSDNPTIPVEYLPGLNAESSARDAAAQQEIRTALGNLGPMNLSKKLADISTDGLASAVDAERNLARDQAGARQAAAAERIALNAARGELWSATNKDTRAIGYVRVSRTGTPCGWCAMLISRGFVEKPKRGSARPLYGSSKGAGGENLTDGNKYEDGDLYHDNCHCYAVPVYALADLQTSDLYALNREYGELWPKVTEGLGGDAALTAWRRFIRTQQRAQAARPTARTAQEA